MLMQIVGDSMRYILLMVIGLMLVGCGWKQVEYVDRPVEVKVPVQCQVPFPVSPKADVSPEGLGKALGYTEELECALHLCRGEKCQ